MQAELQRQQNTATSPAIMLDDVRFAWPGGQRFSVPHWHVDQGARVFLHGPSGSGKSTVLSLICGTLAPQSGEIRVAQADLTAMRVSQRDRMRAETMGVIFQMFNLVPYLSALDNILLPLRFAPERRKRAGDARATGLDLGQRLGLSAGVLQNGPAQHLSIGQQQRVAVARALIGSPPVILADEPTSALDAAAQTAFLDLLFEEVTRVGATLIFVSHDARLADRFDQTLALADILETDGAV